MEAINFPIRSQTKMGRTPCASIPCKWADAALVVNGDADQFGEGLSILSMTITSTSALVG
jgi:hypothetical protein